MMPASAASNSVMMETLRWVGAVGMVVIALGRAMVMFADDAYFDVDPVAVPAMFAGLGPMGSMWLDVALLLFAQVALIGEMGSKRGVEWWLVVMAMLPGAAVMAHGLGSVADLWRGSTWMVSMIALVTLAHLARERVLRAVMLAGLLALIGPLAVRGLVQVLLEHGQLMDDFRQHREAFFAARGWEMDSNQAKLYERRLVQNEATGWFGLANIYGGVMVAMLIGGIGASWAAFRERISGGWTGVVVLTALGAGAGLIMSGSRGAIGAAMLGVALLVVGLLKPGRWRTIAIIALPAVTILGIVARGVMLPEKFGGDLSILFRWHYWIGAARMVVDQPWLGVGPGSFQQAYALVRPLRNPEEVVSAHSVFIDWIATLGVLGAVWVVLMGVLLSRAGWRIEVVEEEGTGTTVELPRRAVSALIVMFVVAGGLSLVVEFASVDQFGLMMRIIGLTAGIIAGAVIAGVALQRPRTLAWVALAAVTGMLIHAQMEMTFFQPGSVVWACLLVGVAAGPGLDAVSPRWKWMNPAGAVVLGVLMIGMIVFALVPVTRQMLLVREAAQTLHEVGEARLRANESRPAIRELELTARQTAARLLAQATEIGPRNERAVRAMIDQHGAGAMLLEGDARQAVLRAAHEKAVQWVGTIDSPSLIALAARTAAEVKAAGGEADELTWRVQLVTLDPYSVDAWRALGDAQWTAGDRTAAAESYGRALELDAALELDPLKQLDAAVRRGIELRMQEVEGDGK